MPIRVCVCVCVCVCVYVHLTLRGSVSVHERVRVRATQCLCEPQRVCQRVLFEGVGVGGSFSCAVGHRCYFLPPYLCAVTQ